MELDDGALVIGDLSEFREASVPKAEEHTAAALPGATRRAEAVKLLAQSGPVERRYLAASLGLPADDPAEQIVEQIMAAAVIKGHGGSGQGKGKDPGKVKVKNPKQDQ